MFIVGAALFIYIYIYICKIYMLINGAAPFINGCPVYKWASHLSADKWCSTVYKWCKFINGAQHIQQENIDRDEVMSSPLLFSQEKSGDRSSPLLFSQEKNEEETVATPLNQPLMCVEEEKTAPVIQPFMCAEEKSPVQYEDTMDTLEEIPVADIGDTYLSDEQFNQKYPQHPIDVSFQSITPVTLSSVTPITPVTPFTLSNSLQ